ncbi:GntR family transcriptional regulator [Fluviispira sanaruensis]|uniref:GntR family transcriptional regulator n=1 Tax=Fluviispira sanaruensis TaxID=2493639 RepID=A0A4V0P252_FLUSA|nr:GntR family transcriptional regulator [Fluviispira sanaruensis]BBH52017.1 GntR family transcriptional regulator [Fluviispira sanaruensis]
MRLQVNPHSSIPLYAQIVEQMRNQILSGIIQAGTALPSVREISEMIEVNSLTIQKALKILEVEKFIIIRRGVGAFVSENINSLNQNQKEDLLKPSLSNIVSHARELGVEQDRFQALVEECWSGQEI